MARGHSAHVVTTERSYKGKTYRSHLLRRSYREGGKIKKKNSTVGLDEATIREYIRNQEEEDIRQEEFNLA